MVNIVAVTAVLTGLVVGTDDGVAKLIPSVPELPSWSLYAAVGIGALGGAAFAARRGFDIIGVLGLAVAQGTGGLLLMSILLQNGTPIVLQDERFMVVTLLCGLVGFFFAGLLARALASAYVLDAMSAGLLCSIGAQAALKSQLDAIPAVFIGLMTAIGGLILRDIMAGRAPGVFQPGTMIALAALLGAVLYVSLVSIDVNIAAAQFATLILVTALRILALRFGWATHEAKDFSDRVWGFWAKAKKSEDTGPMTQQFDRL